MDKKPLVQQGWLRVLIYLIMGLAISIGVVIIANMLLTGSIQGESKKQFDSPQEFMLAYCINTIGLLIAAFAMRKIVDRKPIASLGFHWKGFSNTAWSGFFIGILILSIGSLILMGLRFIYFTGFAFDASNLLMSALLFIIVAFVEETIFRGYVLNNLMDSMHKWIALPVSALVFALFHSFNPDAGVFSVMGIFIAGLLLGINYAYTRNLWFGIFLHFAWNFLQGPVLGYAVSGFSSKGLLQQTLGGPTLWTGGSFGFEASLLALLLQGAAIFLLIRLYEPKVISA
jgi:membrane protease YdiL (CAAX protease family)